MFSEQHLQQTTPIKKAAVNPIVRKAGLTTVLTILTIFLNIRRLTVVPTEAKRGLWVTGLQTSEVSETSEVSGKRTRCRHGGTSAHSRPIHDAAIVRLYGRLT
jgi:hypothetical protein